MVDNSRSPRRRLYEPEARAGPPRQKGDPVWEIFTGYYPLPTGLTYIEETATVIYRFKPVLNLI